jgi:hypothetical protein
VLRERLAERVLELEKDLTLKDRRIAVLEAQVSEPESPAESDREGVGDSHTADNLVGDEDASSSEEESSEGEVGSAASSANVAPVEYEYDIDGDSTDSREEYEDDNLPETTSPEFSTGDFPQLANDFDRVIRDANEEFASEVYQALASSNAELGLTFQRLIGERVNELESLVDANVRKMERIRETIAGLHSLVTSSSDEESSSTARRSEGLFEPYTAAAESDSAALESGAAKGNAFLETVTTTVEEASAPDAPTDLPAREEDAIGDEVDEPAYDNAETPTDEQSSIPIDDPNPDRPEVIPARVETLPKDPFPSDNETKADKASDENPAASEAEGLSDTEDVNLPFAPLVPVLSGSGPTTCRHSSGVPYAP